MDGINIIDGGHPDEWYKDRYNVSFVEEGIFDPRYKDWAGGRMEIYVIGEQYAIDEIRFFTPHTLEWINFREQYELHWLDKATFEEVVNTIKEKFYTRPESRLNN